MKYMGGYILFIFNIEYRVFRFCQMALLQFVANYKLMTKYDFVVVQMIKINARVLRLIQRTSALIFVICTSTK